MNIVIIMSGGIGKRFGSIVPKQYNLVLGRPVIDYVIDAVNSSKKTNKVVVAIDKQWISYSDKLKNSGFDFVPNGETRYKSLKNAINYIKSNYKCKNIVVVDAVAPFITSKIIDDYFDKLDDYDAVITSQKITGGFTDINNTPLDREKFIITQSPEAFNFKLLFDNFDVNYKFQETACMLPKEAKRYYNFDFKNNLKITYDFELKYVELMLKDLGYDSDPNKLTFFDKSVLYTKGLVSGFLNTYQKETNEFIDSVYESLKRMIVEYKLISFLPNQSSKYGLVIEAKSEMYGNIVIKFIPKFVHRFHKEVESYKILSKDFMCELVKVCESDNALILKKIENANYASYKNKNRVEKFFDIVKKDAIKYENQNNIQYIIDYYNELKEKFDNIDNVLYFKYEIKNELNFAIDLYNKEFINDEKFILHLDLHNLNMLDDGSIIKAVDPNGFVAPLAFEFIRFIRNELRTNKDLDIKSYFSELIDFMSKYSTKDKLIKAFLVDLAMCNYNSTFENADDSETKDNIKLFNLVKEKFFHE